MQFTEPRVFLIGETKVDQSGLAAFLDAVGAKDWDTNAPSDAELLIEVAGKTCYKSFNLDINPNLSRVREKDNKGYIGQGILKVKHGSVLEHPNVTLAYHDVSRVFTHEQVRHRIAGYSQESLRFVRLTELKAYFPRVFQEAFLTKIAQYLRDKGHDLAKTGSLYLAPSHLQEALVVKMREVFEYLETAQHELTSMLQLDDLDDFQDKKKLTSAMRRMAPIGLATTIIATANLRTWRYVIEQRTDRHAEEEIRFVYGQVHDFLSRRYPNVFQDATVTYVDELPEVKFQSSKV